ncbi:hypothetical protein HDU76_000179 [Blyttiomyces sp. JEL0837]|nr:hypothetical protein HDU76_000179 [Blyttiomyces sp. JEL0837]
MVFYLIYLLSMLASVFTAHRQEKWRRESFLMEIQASSARSLCREEAGKSSLILRSIFNERVIDVLTKNETAGLVQCSTDAAVLALDVVSFTNISSGLTPAQVVSMLNELYLDFDEACVVESVEKICTIGDAYIAVAGLPFPLKNPSISMCRVALKIQAAISRFNVHRRLTVDIDPNSPVQVAARGGLKSPIQARIGVFSGTVYCAVIGGTTKLKYDIVGDSIELATELEQTALPGTVHVSQNTFEAVGRHSVFEPRYGEDSRGGETDHKAGPAVSRAPSYTLREIRK